ncbi:hypothetical protein OUZ56_012324 [Daphnia magna]|uniref:Uncharacterized protein n=1 Tax=Daphnia magna TaxID=35525 RepID=A0ABQ9Z2N7_9CRUS|nr:hypothetical protein OUZ56_012324 [Daphnia magna]
MENYRPYPNSTLLTSDVRFMAKHPFDIHVLYEYHYVNFNGRHVYRNGTWKKAEATLLQPERDFSTSFRYDDDYIHDCEPQANPVYDGITTSYMNIIADLAAALAEQSMKTGMN